MKYKSSFLLPALLLLLSLTARATYGQTGPPVLIKIDIDGGLIGTANGVVIGRHKDHAVIITNAHVALQARALTVLIDNKPKIARIINTDPVNDFTVIAIDGDYRHLKFALMAIEIPVGTRLKYCGYLPQNNWQLGCIPTRRIRNEKLRWYALDMRAVGGMSGGGIYTLDGHLAAILSLSQDGQTQVIPTPVIRKRLIEWGLVDGLVKGSEPDLTDEPEPKKKKEEQPRPAEMAIKEPEPKEEKPQQPKPEKPIEKIKDVAIFGAKTWLRIKYGSVLTAALSAAGGIGWVIGKKIDRKHEQRNGGDIEPTDDYREMKYKEFDEWIAKNYKKETEEKKETERVITIDTAPPEQFVTPEVRYAPYAVDEFSDAFAWAETQMVRKYPGSIGTIETLKSMIDQYLSSKKKDNKK